MSIAPLTPEDLVGPQPYTRTSQGVFTVLVVVGTDHHRFDRLVDWVDAWLQDQAEPVRVVFQHGSARRPDHAEGHRLLPHEELQQLMSSADVLVTHGGPATICEAWQYGRLPLVVPRDPELGEHVDGHQQRFSRRLGAQGLVRLCEDQATFVSTLETARRDPSTVERSYQDRAATVSASVARLAQVVDESIRERAQRRGLSRLGLQGVRRRAALRRGREQLTD